VRRRRRGTETLWLTVLVAAGLTLWCVTQTAAAGLQAPVYDVVFVLLIALGEVLRVRTPTGTHGSAPIALAAASGLTLMAGSYQGQALAAPVCEAVTVTAAGMMLGSLVFTLGRRDPATARMAVRLVSVAAVCELFHVLAGVGRPALSGAGRHWWAAVTTVAAMLIGVVYLLLGALVEGTSRHARLRVQLRDELDADGAGGLVTAAAVATGAVIAVGSQDLGVWAGVIFTVPMLGATAALRRHAAIRETQAQTVRALSRAAEVAGYIEVGHTDRVADLCVRMGQVVGLPARRTNELRSAALMHDIGQLSLLEPIPGGATLLATSAQRAEIADRGAEVLRRADVMPVVAQIMAEQAIPFAELDPHSQVRVEAQVVAVANAFDDLVGAEPSYQRQLQALERLRLGASTLYDPNAVEALEQVLALP
jgi:hypothetical protein